MCDDPDRFALDMAKLFKDHADALERIALHISATKDICEPLREVMILMMVRVARSPELTFVVDFMDEFISLNTSEATMMQAQEILNPDRGKVPMMLKLDESFDA